MTGRVRQRYIEIINKNKEFRPSNQLFYREINKKLIKTGNKIVKFYISDRIIHMELEKGFTGRKLTFFDKG